MPIEATDALPAAWLQALQRHASPAQLAPILQLAKRYLAHDSAERVPLGREPETLENVLHMYLPETLQAAVYRDVAMQTLTPAPSRRSGGGAALAALGTASAIAILATRRR